MSDGWRWNEPHWCEQPALRIQPGGRRPATLKEWLRCLWNFDIFLGRVPFLKLLLLVNML